MTFNVMRVVLYQEDSSSLNAAHEAMQVAWQQRPSLEPTGQRDRVAG